MPRAHMREPVMLGQNPPATSAAGPQLEQTRCLRSQGIPAPKQPQGATGNVVSLAALAF